MNFSSRIILALLLLCGLSACVTDANIVIPNESEKLVMIGILHPDSIISVRILKTLPALSKATKYPVVEDAQVTCYTGENEAYLGTLKPELNGRYVLPVQPVYGEKYTIRVKAGTVMLQASDYMPTPVYYEIALDDTNPRNPNQNPDLMLKVGKKIKENEVIWLTTILRELKYGADSVYINLSNLIMSSSPVFDPFNSGTIPDYPQLSYTYLGRLKPEFGGDLEVRFTIFNGIKAAIRQKGSLTVKVLTTSVNYDKYLKSAFISTTNKLTDEEGGLVNPFYAPSNTFSNVENGLGIFGAMIETDFVFNKIE